ncbi:MAG: VWA domain-containing protein [Pyrinomonadaceae bacterium]|nr:VWA domain-containing protein [Pyrinomonadaceae bacterium]
MNKTQSRIGKAYALAIVLGTLALLSFAAVTSGSGQAASQTGAREKAAPPNGTDVRSTASQAAKPPTTPIAVPRLSSPSAASTTPPTPVPTQTQTPTQKPPQSTMQTPAQTTAPTTPMPAEQKPPPADKTTPPPGETIDDEEVIRVTSNLVVVPVSVTNAKGEPVQGLKVPDFRLEEQGRAQEVAQIGDPDQVPIELVLLLDISGSVNARFAFEQEAASRFLKEVLKASDRASLYSIAITPRQEQARATADVTAQKLMAIQPAKGPTAFYDTVIEAAKYLSNSTPARHRRVIVAITDGEDNYSEKVKAAIGATREEQDATTPAMMQRVREKALLEVQREVQRTDTVFYSINPSGLSLRLNVISQRAQDGMSKLAEATGGTAFVPEALEDLGDVFRQIAAELRSQYLLQYYSNSQAPPGKYLGIKVRVPARADLRVRARQGYYVPQPK